MIFDMSSILAYVVGLIVVFFVCWLFIKPLKWVLRLVINAIFGGIILAVINLAGGFLGLTLAINPLTAIVAGILGIPGVILLVVLTYIL